MEAFAKGNSGVLVRGRALGWLAGEVASKIIAVYWWLIMGIFPHIVPAREAVAHCGPAAVATGSQ